MNENDKNIENQNENAENPLKVYAVVSQVGFIVVTPLLLFIWGGSWLVDKFSLPEWLRVVFIILGIVFMLLSLAGYLMQLARRYDNGKNHSDKYNRLKYDRRDNDYYDETIKKHKL